VQVTFSATLQEPLTRSVGLNKLRRCPLENLKLIGALLGIVSFTWKLIEVLISHVNLMVEAERIKGSQNEMPTLKLSISNSENVPKKLHYVCLMLYPDDITINSAIKIIKNQIEEKPANGPFNLLDIYHTKKLGTSIASTSELVFLIPVSFFHLEQMQVGNETISHRLSLGFLPECTNRPLQVRLIVFTKYFGFYVRWRQSSELILT